LVLDVKHVVPAALAFQLPQASVISCKLFISLSFACEHQVTIFGPRTATANGYRRS
jgi:hypothetical protein